MDSPYFNTIPDEIIILILDYLHDNQLTSVASTCRRMRILCNDILYRRIKTVIGYNPNSTRKDGSYLWMTTIDPTKDRIKMMMKKNVYRDITAYLIYKYKMSINISIYDNRYLNWLIKNDMLNAFILYIKHINNHIERDICLMYTSMHGSINIFNYLFSEDDTNDIKAHFMTALANHHYNIIKYLSTKIDIIDKSLDTYEIGAIYEIVENLFECKRYDIITLLIDSGLSHLSMFEDFMITCSLKYGMISLVKRYLKEGYEYIFSLTEYKYSYKMLKMLIKREHCHRGKLVSNIIKHPHDVNMGIVKLLSKHIVVNNFIDLAVRRKNYEVIIILIDNGATYSYVKPETMAKLKCKERKLVLNYFKGFR